MDVADAIRAEDFFGALEGARNFVGGLDVIHFDVDDAEAEGEARIDVLESIEVGGWTMGEFEDEVVGVEVVEKGDERGPFAFLDGLAAVIAEAEVHGFFDTDGIEDPIDRFRSEGAVGGIAGDVGFVDLDARAIQVGHLCGESVGNREGEFREAVVVLVEKCAREHIRAGNSELEWPACDRGGAGAVFGEVQDAFGDRGGDDGGGFIAPAHFFFGAEGGGVAAADFAADAAEFVDEVFDHPVGVGMIDVEAVEFAISGEVDAGLALKIEDDARGVDERLFAGQCGKPIRDRIGADRGRQDSRYFSQIHYQCCWIITKEPQGLRINLFRPPTWECAGRQDRE